MEPITVGLAIIASLSEILPLLGFTRINGVLHGIQSFIIHIHADSECHVTLDVDNAQTSAAPGGAEGPAFIASPADTPP
jgi:hypothetical protein